MKNTHRLLAAALALIVLLTLLPAAALAETSSGSLSGGTGSLGGGSSSDSGSGSASNTAVYGVTTATCNFRTGSSTSSAKVSGCSTVPKGASVVILDNTTGGKYWKVTYKTYTGWIYGPYVKITSAPGETAPTGSGAAAVTTATCNFRTGSSTSSAKVAGCSTIPKGASIVVLDNTSGGSYWKVSYKSYTGWIYGPYVKLAGASGGGTTGGTLSYARYTGTSEDQWGYMQVDGTNISQAIYCNAIDSKGNFYYNAYSSSYNYFYALSYVTNPIAVIYGHNMRKSGTGMHQLHHVQNAWLGKAKCEYCGKDCSGAKTNVFNISYNGSTRWQLVGFFEASSSTISSSTTRKNLQLMAAMQSYRTGSALQEWIDYMMGYCKSAYKGATLGSMTSSDKVMVIVTCADSSGDSYQRMYMLLKAIG